MMNLLAVCAGGAVGSGLRYLIALGATRFFGGGYPHGTMIANVVGCFLMGIVAYLGLRSSALPEHWRLGIGTGLLGGFTTFSTFSFETLSMARTGNYTQAALYAGLTLALCLAAVTLGFLLATKIWGPIPALRA
jgi:CrcB protein